MSNAEAGASSPNKKPRFSLAKSMIGIGFFANQALYGSSDAVAAHTLDDPGLEQIGATRAGISFAIAAAGIWYVRKHYHQNHPAIEHVTDVAEVIPLPVEPLPAEVDNPAEEAA